jgi:hypothetical protein
VVKRLALAILILLCGSLPPFVKHVFNQSSLAMGLIIYCLLISIYVWRYAPRLFRPNKYIASYLGIAALYMVLQVIISAGWSSKAYASLLPIICILTIAYLLSARLSKINPNLLDGAVRFLAGLLIIIAFTNKIFDFRFNAYTHERAIVPFSEPSHYALFSGPIFTYLFVCARSISKKLLIFISTSVLAIILPSTTMLAYPILMLALWANIHRRFLITIPILLATIWFALFQSDYHFERVMMIANEDTTNISALVYAQGVTDAYNSLIETNFIGLGFQMMGAQQASDVSDLISRFSGSDVGLNRMDGSFLASKIIAEFGAFGLLTVAIFTLFALRSFSSLRALLWLDRNDGDHRSILVYVFLYSFLVELYIRGYGYFSPGVFIYISSIAYYFKYIRTARPFSSIDAIRPNSRG